ncbi:MULTISPECIES: helix-turn-helix domain-containing protein [Legionella]|uniref:Putative Fis-like DNA-binding protein n=1 Tax=Legionella septentrionalis TaxID=2498109 RepID=A0A433JK86_9GAMM|nr:MULTISPECIES: helix-turn-helix domain-containing protein [Legionella]MCP0914313.1 Fis family transcriptional regulator [Legionella sp. 27cVA30]RUQ89026.1 Fis family transcriptional regulator [Legionella septentrionalis]RUR00333.1 Fis family transcriptional regulator [Legionella septentrionalis]RUR11810.1 Fis family transcriptional regulator [Legionella septentrionalis]RUR17498.1 Fis family transcriptional regulator [Legionella septentrionalis]
MSAVMQEMQHSEALSQQVINAVKGYLNAVNSKDANLNLYQLIVEEVEAPLFRTVMELTRYNQSKAARVLGVSRGTLRTKLKRYFDDEFIGTRDI